MILAHHRVPGVFFAGAIWAAIWTAEFAGCGKPDALPKAAATVPKPAHESDDGEVGDALAGAPPRPFVESVPVAPRATAGGVAGVGGSAGISDSRAPTGGALTVVILMLPKSDDAPDRPMAPRSYKLSITADARTATVEVDGQTVGSANVERVYPLTRSPRVAARSQPLRNPLPRRADVAGEPSAEAPRIAPSTRAERDGMDVPLHSSTLNPNGAPIID